MQGSGWVGSQKFRPQAHSEVRTLAIYSVLETSPSVGVGVGVGIGGEVCRSPRKFKKKLGIVQKIIFPNSRFCCRVLVVVKKGTHP